MRTGRNRLAISFALVTSILLSSLTVAAQGSSAGDWSRLNTLKTGSKLTVNLKDGKTVKGKLSGVSDATLSLTVKDKPVDLNKSEVLSVYHHTKKSAAKSTLIGLGVGAGAGAAVGLAATKADDNDFLKLDHAVTAGLTVLGAGAGAITGLIVGKTGGKRVLVYQAK